MKRHRLETKRWRLLPLGAVACATALAGGGTVITVDWSIDEAPDSNTHTCTYAQGGLFNPAADGHCTFRRALREAGARPPADQPIRIVFSGLAVNGDADDGNFDPATGTWTLPLSRSSSQSRLALRGQSILEVAGNVTIDGGPPVAGGPAVFIDTRFPIEIEKADNVIRRLGFFGGGSIRLKEANNVVENITWGLSPDGQAIVFEDAGANADALAGAQGVAVARDGGGAVIRASVISGASTRAIEVASGTTGVRIEGNFIGTRRDGTVPARPPAIECQAIGPFGIPPDPQDWYGGWGISLAGTGAVVTANTIAGLQNLRSTNDTPPMALEIFGADHALELNVIGEDTARDPVGVCGQGIKFSGEGHRVRDNLLVRVRPGFENTDGAILWSDDGFTDDGGNTVRRNLSIDGPARYFEMGPQIGVAIRTFEPAVVDHIDGLTVSGTSAPGNPCPGCVIDLYADDTDDREEALAHLGSATADANGAFTFTLPRELTSAEGLRTTSTTAADGVIPGTLAGTTTVLSALYRPARAEVIFTSSFEVDEG